MKKTLYHIGMLAAAALAFAACAKEIDKQETMPTVTREATITLGKAGETKTVVVEGQDAASYKWNDNDAQYLHVFENGVEGTVTQFTLNSEKTVATIKVSFEGTPEAPISYVAKYAKEIAASSKNPRVLATQNPLTNSFDPAADILVSKATDDVTNLSEPLTELTFTMGRVVTVNRMTLTGLEAGEVVSSVEFELGKNIIGYIKYTDEEGYSCTSDGKKLTLNYSSSTGVVPANGEFPVYFTCAPVEGAGIVSVIVNTDKHVYTKSNTLDPNPFDGKTITFAIGTMKRFKMAMSGFGEEISNAVDYTLVTSAAGLPDYGDIIIVNGTNAMAEDKGNNRGVATVPAANAGVISLDNTSTAHVFTLVSTASGYLISDKADDKYLYAASTSNNYLKSKETIGDDCYWNLAYTDGTLSISSISNTERGLLRYNPNTSGTPLFSCYGSGQQAVSIYLNLDSVKEFVATPTIVAAANGTSIEVVWEDVANATSYLVTCTGQESQTINPGVKSAVFENLADGYYDVTVVAQTTVDGYVDSPAAVSSDIKVGTPTLSVPQNVTASQTANGFSASWDAVEGAEIYSWTLYDDAALQNPVAGASTSTNSLTADINDTDWLIEALVSGTTYYFTVSASGTGYNASAESSAVSFTAKALAKKQFVASDFTSNLTVTKTPITAAFAKGGGTTDPNVSTSRVRLYQNNSTHKGGTLTITSTSANIQKVEISFEGNQTYLTSDAGSYSNGTWTTDATVESVVFYCNGESSSQRADITGFTVYYVSDGTPEPEQLVMGNIVCDNSGENENSLTFSWEAVTGATGYQVSTDGSTFGSTQSGLTYTLSGLEPGTSHTIWVKAIGDGTNHTDSEAKQSASGTTKSNGSGGNDPVEVTFTAGTDTGETSVTKDGITVSMSTMSRHDNYRTYANSNMTVTASSGKTIIKVVVTCTASGTSNYGPGKFSGNGYSYSGTEGTWSGSSNSVSLSASAQVRMTQIVVTYTE